MLSFLKVFARGVICTVLLPLILLVWVLYGVYCLITFIVMLFKSIILFFAGDNAAGELPEDIEAKKLLLEREQSQLEQAQVMSMMYQNMAVQQQMMQQAMGQQFNQPPFSQQTYPQQPIQQQYQQQPVQQPYPQQPVQQQTPQPQSGFDPFIPDPVEEQPLPSPSNTNNEEGGNNND